MLRLFVSLYFVVIAGIFAINWASELVWTKLNQERSSELSTAITLAQDLAQLLSNKQQLTHLNTGSLTYQLIEISDIAWLPEQLALLKSGQALPLYNLQQQLFIYVATKQANQLLQVGPIVQQQNAPLSKIIIQICSYLLLALVIALWTRPIWQDLTKLTTLANNINDLKNVPNDTVYSRSPIANIVRTMNQMAMRIQHLINEQKQLVNAVSHELRTPLSRLRFSLAMLENVDAEQKTAIEQDLQEIATLVDEMLSYSRIEHIAIEQSKTTANISDLLNNQLDKHRRAHQINIMADFPDKLSLVCNGELVERACQNLITNALRYAKQRIKVSAKIDSQALTISIEDDGAGIDQAYWPTLFEPFSRIEKSRDKTQGGYGLGLAIVKKACDWHQGQCTISHSPLGGACFTIRLPVA